MITLVIAVAMLCFASGSEAFEGEEEREANIWALWARSAPRLEESQPLSRWRRGVRC